MRHQTERPMPIHPPVTVTFTPRGLLIQSVQPSGDEPWRSLLGVPDRSPRVIHHLIAAHDLTRSIHEEIFEQHILELFQAGSRFFLTVRVIGFR
jgi:hypothetical protein